MKATVDFLEEYKISNSLCEFSPNGLYLASGYQKRLVIRDVAIREAIKSFNCVDYLQTIQWSPDSEFILCGTYKQATVQVWTMNDDAWTCTIVEGTAGLVSCIWSPDSRHILTTTDFHVRITVWSLANKTVAYIKHTREGNPGIEFSPNGCYLAVAERRDCKDSVSIFDVNAWQIVKHFECRTKDVAGLKWAPNSDVICIWDSPLYYNIFLYTLNGLCLANYCAYEWALGIKSAVWSPSGQLLSVGSYDQKIRILNCFTWNPVEQFTHINKIEDSEVMVYQEVHNSVENVYSTPKTLIKITEDRPFNIPSNKPDPDKANPKIGPGKFKFSGNGLYLASINDNMPATLWVWNMETLKLFSVIQFNKGILDFEWDLQGHRIIACIGGSKICIWSPKDCYLKDCLIEKFEPMIIKLHPDDRHFLAVYKDVGCLCSVKI